MNNDRILVPIDLAKCPVEAFALINAMPDHTNVSVILLHVVNPSAVSPDGRVYDGLCHDAERRLERLAREYLPPDLDTTLRVRVGNPFDEIAAEAREQHASLIMLPTFPQGFWQRLFQAVPRLAEKLAGAAPCPVFAVPVKRMLNCERYWTFESEFAAVGDARA